MALFYTRYDYEKDATDLGSFKRGKDNNYYGLKADIDKLPKYNGLPHGTAALCVDTGDTLVYLSTTKTWYLMP